ncbi:hypothetical protein HHX47_DHR10000356 [Lentinula edodes]|nr:hypothetical protein HHX47_DHR10000356 [Lentinula edodes]
MRQFSASESRDESQINPARLPGNIASLRLTKSKKDAEMYSNVLHNKIKAAEETQTSQTTRDTRARPNSPVPSDTVSTRNAARKPSVPVASNNANVVVTPSASAEVQLRALVARKLGVEGGNEDPEVERVFQGFIKVAKARARNQVRYTGNMGIGEPVSEEILDTLAAEVRDAQQGTQNSESLVPNKSPTRVEPDFGHEVRKILGLSEAEHKSQYLEAMQIRPRDLSSSQRARETETIASYESQKQQIEDTIEKLLIRKIDKADSLGHSLVRDIEALLIGIDDIVGHGNSGRDPCNSKNMTVVRSHSNHT